MNFYRPSFFKKLYPSKNRRAQATKSESVVNNHASTICPTCKQDILNINNSVIKKETDLINTEENIQINIKPKISQHSKLSQCQIRKLFH